MHFFSLRLLWQNFQGSIQEESFVCVC
jgi:hypothetical protein